MKKEKSVGIIVFGAILILIGFVILKNLFVAIPLLNVADKEMSPYVTKTVEKKFKEIGQSINAKIENKTTLKKAENKANQIRKEFYQIKKDVGKYKSLFEIIFILFGISLIISGIGLIRFWPWARNFTLWLIFLGLIMVILFWSYVLIDTFLITSLTAEITKFANEFLWSQQRTIPQPFMVFFRPVIFAIILVYIVFSSLIFYWLTRPHIKQQFARKNLQV